MSHFLHFIGSSHNIAMAHSVLVSLPSGRTLCCSIPSPSSSLSLSSSSSFSSSCLSSVELFQVANEIRLREGIPVEFQQLQQNCQCQHRYQCQSRSQFGYGEITNNKEESDERETEIEQQLTDQIDRLSINSQCTPTSSTSLPLSSSSPLHFLTLSLSLLGGKGGFGSLLRATTTKVGAKKTSNFTACRDLQGRRIRHVEQAKKLQEWKQKGGSEQGETGVGVGSEAGGSKLSIAEKFAAIKQGKPIERKSCKFGLECKYRWKCKLSHPDEQNNNKKIVAVDRFTGIVGEEERKEGASIEGNDGIDTRRNESERGGA